MHSPTLIEKLHEVCQRLTVILTPTATKMVNPALLRMIGSTAVLTDADTHWTNHMALAASSDLLLIAPATANTIGKMANGISDNLLTTLALAVEAPIVIAPSMSASMSRNPLIAQNIKRVKDVGIEVVPQVVGREASTLTPAFGAMPKAESVVSFILQLRRRRNTEEARRFSNVNLNGEQSDGS
jgi:phosphopantothenoylcysteine decarboxylase / phosphopantothenate---cysteine ligase